MRDAILLLMFAAAWVGHACVWVSVLNNLYGRPISKLVLKPLRLLTGVLILAFPLLPLSAFPLDIVAFPSDPWGWAVLAYVAVCVVVGGAVFPFITVKRLIRKSPAAVVSEQTQTLDLWPELGSKLHGDGKFSWAPQLPFTCVYRVDFTELALALPQLPPQWDGLTILFLSDMHFHGTPSRMFFERVLNEIEDRWPSSDLVCLGGDYVDTDTHHEWIGPLLGRLRANEAKLAILGNHDEHHHPEQVREALAAAGYTLLSNRFDEPTTAPQTVPIRGVRCIVVGHEGPWFTPDPPLLAASESAFRLCLSHTPDNFYWGQRNHIDLMLCGHVHGGQVRVPVVGSIFVPSIYGRRFDQGVFEEHGTVMVANRGLSGKEPLRFRCHPQVLRITLTRRSAPE